MNKFFFALALLLFCQSVFGFNGVTHGSFVSKKKELLCHNNKPHALSVDAKSVNGTFIYLNDVDHIVTHHCNTKGDKILLVFLWPTFESDFKKQLEAGTPYHTFITGSDHRDCNNHPIMKRVISWKSIVGFGLELELSDAKYDQVFESAELSFGPDASGQLECASPEIVDKPICLGYNTASCTSSENPIQIWQNQYFDVVCSDCYVGLETDVFFNVSIQDFSLNAMSVGFTNTKAVGALVVDFAAHKDWSTGVNKDLPIVQSANVFDFFIGPVPFHVWFEIPMNLQASASFSSEASMALGADVDIDIGDLYVNWESQKGWSSVVGKPKFEWSPQITEPQGQFDATAQISLVPSFIAHFDELFTTKTILTPVLSAETKGSASTSGYQVCGNFDYNVQAETSADLQISLPWIDVNKDYHWEKTLIQTGTVPIGKVCVNGTTSVSKNTRKTHKPVPEQFDLTRVPETPQGASSRNKPLRFANFAKDIFDNQPTFSYVEPKKELVSGIHEVCLYGRPHQLRYEGTISGNFVKLEDISFITGIQCNVDTTKLLINFVDAQSAQLFASKNLTAWTTFLSAGDKYKCDGGNMFRRVISWEVNNKQVNLKTQNGLYSEVFEDTSISFGPTSDSLSSACKEVDYQVCLPVNANSNCTEAAKPITIYQNPYVTLTCSNCFLGLKMDVFFNIKMSGFALEEFQGGFKNINLFGGLVVDWLSTHDWSINVDRSFPLIAPKTILNFWVGSIPITINLAAPVEIQMSANFDATAEATIGATTDLSFGEASVDWKWDQGWSHVSPNPSLNWKEVFTAPSAQFTGNAHYAIIPSWTMKVDGFYSLEFVLTPTVDMEASGTLTTKTGKVCADIKDQTTLTVESDLQIAIPWVSLKYDFDYGPKNIYDSGQNTLAQKCLSF